MNTQLSVININTGKDEISPRHAQMNGATHVLYAWDTPEHLVYICGTYKRIKQHYGQIKDKYRTMQPITINKHLKLIYS